MVGEVVQVLRLVMAYRAKDPFPLEVGNIDEADLARCHAGRDHQYMQIRHPLGFDSWLHDFDNNEAVDAVLESMDKKLCRDELEHKTSGNIAGAQCKEYIGGSRKDTDSSSGKGSVAQAAKLGDLPAPESKTKAKPAKVDSRAKADATPDLDRAIKWLPVPADGRCFIQA